MDGADEAASASPGIVMRTVRFSILLAALAAALALAACGNKGDLVKPTPKMPPATTTTPDTPPKPAQDTEGH
ncbi:MAG TPA: lipoprotein [Rhodanobacteraceae bacterium]|nr:lipoprotein [Rhodanobacteraceae bacterium]